MSPRTRRRLVQIGSFVLAGVLLYFALRGVDLGAVAGALRRAEYVWLGPLIFVVVLSHVMRAWRWQILLETLPAGEDERPRPRVPITTAFYSVMIGYMVNYAAPRLGEVARTANLAARERMRFSAVFGTVVIERILDVVLLAVALVSAFLLLLDRLPIVDELFLAPLVEQVGRVPTAALAGLAVAVAALIVMVYRHAVRAEDTFLRVLWQDRLAPIVASFKDGLLSLVRMRRPVALVVSTVVMWFCYLLMAHLPFVILGMDGLYDLTLLDTWVIMVVGAIGVVIPSPGGVGSYHYITIQTLVHLFAVDADAAATYAVLAHGAQLVLYVGLGGLSLLLQGSSLEALRERTEAARAGRESA